MSKRDYILGSFCVIVFIVYSVTIIIAVITDNVPLAIIGSSMTIFAAANWWRLMP